ncbi:MAG: hypothetical protein ACOYMN_12920 [Roseimicrobium sp.]
MPAALTNTQPSRKRTHGRRLHSPVSLRHATLVNFVGRVLQHLRLLGKARVA